MKDNKVYIRVDGNSIIATGHVMRCLTIANQLQNMGVDIAFVLADDKPCYLLDSTRYEIDIINSKWDDYDYEIGIMSDYIKDNDVKALLIDSYYVTRKYLDAISKLTKIIYIDDLNSFVYPVHTVINYHPWIQKYDYKEACYASYGTDFLLGSQYTPLREEFIHSEYKVNKEIKKILITTGGADSHNLLGNILSEIQKTVLAGCVEIYAIVGIFNEHKNELKELAKNNDSVTLYENVPDMSKLMKQCDIAVSAGGATLYELCACGIPTVNVQIADNQQAGNVLAERDCVLFAGDVREGMTECVENVINCIYEYKNNYELRVRHSEAMREMFDGLGANRIAKYIKALVD